MQSITKAITPPATARRRWPGAVRRKWSSGHELGGVRSRRGPELWLRPAMARPRVGVPTPRGVHSLTYSESTSTESGFSCFSIGWNRLTKWKFPITAERRRRALTALTARFGVAERRACRVLGQRRSTQRLPTPSAEAGRGQAHPPAASAGEGPPPDGLGDGPRRPPPGGVDDQPEADPAPVAQRRPAASPDLPEASTDPAGVCPSPSSRVPEPRLGPSTSRSTRPGATGGVSRSPTSSTSTRGRPWPWRSTARSLPTACSMSSNAWSQPTDSRAPAHGQLS